VQTVIIFPISLVTNPFLFFFYYYSQYLTDLQCPLKSKQKNSVLDWLLSHAIRLEYADNGKIAYDSNN